jgi:hypothetical protein
MSKRRLVNSCLIAALAIVAPRLAIAADLGGSGNACQPGFGRTTVFYDDFGMGNPSTTEVNRYICPIVNARGKIETFSLGYTDRSPGEDLVCYTVITHVLDHAQEWGATRRSCETKFGGCPMNDPRRGPPPAFTGMGFIWWKSSDLPSGAPFSVEEMDSVGFVCNIPRSTEGSWRGMSWINAFGAFYAR